MDRSLAYASGCDLSGEILTGHEVAKPLRERLIRILRKDPTNSTVSFNVAFYNDRFALKQLFLREIQGLFLLSFGNSFAFPNSVARQLTAIGLDGNSIRYATKAMAPNTISRTKMAIVAL